MRCSECSAPITPVVALDIDGTLGDFHAHFISFLESYLNWPFHHCCGFEMYDGAIAFNQWARETYGIDYRTWQDIKLAYRQGAQKRSMPVIPGAENVVLTAAREGCEIWFTTTRPYLRLDNIDPDTRFWLDNVLGVEDLYSGMIYDELKYERFRELVDPERVILILEDLPEMYDAAAVIFGEEVPVLVDSIYNSEAQDSMMTTVSDMYALPGLIMQRANRWRLEHGD